MTVYLFIISSVQRSTAQTHTARNISMTANSDGYYEYLPQGYNSGSQDYPLILFAHGAGELGNVPLSALLGAGLPRLINEGKFPASFNVNGQASSFIVISPHFTMNWPVPTDIQEILDYVVQHYRVDQNRIYMTGLSMGGGITWDYAGGDSVYANRLAAIVPIAGASWPDFSRGRVIANANLPVWATHNNADQVVYVSSTNDYIAYINTNPAPVPLAKKTIFLTAPDNNHDAWTKTYDPDWRDDVPGGPNIYEWMLQYHRNFDQAPSANAGPSQTIIIPASQVILTGSGTAYNGASIAGYDWAQVSGTAAAISSPSAASTTVTGLTDSGSYIFRLTVTDNRGRSGTSEVTVNVNLPGPPAATAGAAQTIQLPTSQVTLTGTGTANNGGSIVAYSWTQADGTAATITSPSAASTTVAGLTTSGARVFRLRVTDNDGDTATSDVTITVLPENTSTAFTGTRKPIPGKLEAEEYDNGGQNIAYLDGTAVNSGGAFRPAESVDVRTCPDIGGGYCIGWTTDGEWVKYSVNVTTAGTYIFTARIASPNTGKSIQLQVDGAVAGTLSVLNTGGFNNWQTATLNNVQLTAGDHSFRFLFNTGDAINTDMGFDINWFNFDLAPNQFPTANAGPNQTIVLPTNQVTLAGSGTANNGGTITYAWTELSGPNQQTAPVITTPTAAGTDVTGLIQGVYIFRLTVTRSGDNKTATSDVTVTVNPVSPPTANAGTNQVIVLPTNQVTLSGSGAANNGGTITYAWTELSGPNQQTAPVITTPTAASTTVTGLIQGVYTFMLTVTRSGDNQAATSDVTVTVSPANTSTAFTGTRKSIPGKLEAEEYDNGGRNIAYLDGTVVNSGGAFRPAESVDVRTCPDIGGGYCVGWTTDGEWVKYSVNVTTTGAYIFTARIASPNTGKSIQLQVDGAVAGTLSVLNTGGFNNWQTAALNNVQLTAGDHTFQFVFNTGDANNTDMGFDINWFNFDLAPNQLPVANAGSPQIIVLPTNQVGLSGSGAANNGGTITYAWTRISGPNAAPALSIVTPTAASTNVTGLIQGTYVFRLTVTRNDNQAATSDVIITVNPVPPPTANAGSNQTILLPTSQATLTGTGTANNGGTITYAWTQVSGPQQQTAPVITTPTSSGTTVTGLIQGVYTFRLTVTRSGDNQSATSDVTVTVSPVQPPTANAGSAQAITLPTSQVTLTGSGAAGNGGTITYGWTQVSGTAATITTPSSASATVTGLSSSGIRVFRLTVTQSDNQTATSDVTITVNPASNGKTIPGKIEAESWDAKSGGMYAIPTTDAGGGMKVVGISNGSSMDYNVTVNQSGTYTVNFRIATTKNKAQFQVKLGNTVIGTVNIPSSGDWNTWITVPLNNVSLTAGAQTLRILSTNNENCDFNWTDWVLVASPGATANKIVVIEAPVQKEIATNGLVVSVFPNPASAYFNLKVQGKSMELVTIKVFDMSGRQVQQMKIIPGQVLSFGDQLINGTYLVEVRQGLEKVVAKVVKQ